MELKVDFEKLMDKIIAWVPRKISGAIVGSIVIGGYVYYCGQDGLTKSEVLLGICMAVLVGGGIWTHYLLEKRNPTPEPTEEKKDAD